jgi:hypothetical protein
MITKRMMRDFSETAGSRSVREFWDSNSKRYQEPKYLERKECNKQRDKVCRTCGCEFTPDNPRQSDHNIALSQTGTHSGRNVFDICRKCHCKKTPHMQDSSGATLFKRG